jgi:DNA replication protein DnaC
MSELSTKSNFAGMQQAIKALPVSNFTHPQAGEDERAKAETMRQRAIAWQPVARAIGLRYAKATFESFEQTLPKQADAVASVRNLVARWSEHADTSLLLYGPRGTGKDHLAVAALRHVAMEHGATVGWVDGETLWREQRDVIGSDTRESELEKKYTSPAVLLISDPARQGTDLTDGQRSLLWRIVDRRYRDMQPTWATVNVLGRDELDQRLSPQISDRMRDNALAVFCSWPSYRSVAKS